MADEAAAEKSVPQAVRALMDERQEARPDRPYDKRHEGTGKFVRTRSQVHSGSRPPKPVSPLPAELAELSAADLKAAFQRKYFALLMKPEVMEAIERKLRSREEKTALKDILGVLLPALIPHEKGSGSGATRVTFVSKIDRAGDQTTAAKVETGGDS